MSDDWSKDWYRGGKPAGADPALGSTVPVAGPQGAGRPGGPWPTQPPPRSARGGYPGGGQYSGAGGGGAGNPGMPRRRGWRRWVRAKRLLILFVTLVVVLALAGTFLYFNVNGKLNRGNVLVSYSGRPAPTAGTNWLITGSDSRAGLSRSAEAQLRSRQREPAGAGQHPA